MSFRQAWTAEDSLPPRLFRPLWALLARIASEMDRRRMDSVDFTNFLVLFGKRTPCETCSTDFLKRVATMPKSRSYLEFVTSVRADVSRALNKTIYSAHECMSDASDYHSILGMLLICSVYPVRSRVGSSLEVVLTTRELLLTLVDLWPNLSLQNKTRFQHALDHGLKDRTTLISFLLQHIHIWYPTLPKQHPELESTATFATWLNQNITQPPENKQRQVQNEGAVGSEPNPNDQTQEQNEKGNEHENTKNIQTPEFQIEPSATPPPLSSRPIHPKTSPRSPSESGRTSAHSSILAPSRASAPSKAGAPSRASARTEARAPSRASPPLTAVKSVSIRSHYPMDSVQVTVADNVGKKPVSGRKERVQWQKGVTFAAEPQIAAVGSKVFHHNNLPNVPTAKHYGSPYQMARCISIVILLILSLLGYVMSLLMTYNPHDLPNGTKKFWTGAALSLVSASFLTLLIIDYVA